MALSPVPVLLFLACALPVMGRAIRASLDPVKDEPAITPEDLSHWAFSPLRRPDPPAVRQTGAVRNVLDLFIMARLEEAGLAFSPQADPATLIRRVTFDLTGLPPGEAEVREFAKAPTDQAYEALVDRLLASERHGEHAALSWLDLARYAETDGFEHDLERRQAWRYRDWVVQSLNRDLPFDEFVRLQIAGDELADDQAAATGFLMSGPDMPDINNQEERRHAVLNDITATVGSAFLGLTVGCAQCHDHPYDPVSQADFYRLRAFFDNMADMQRDRQLFPGMVERGPEAALSPVSIRGDYRRPGPQVAPAFPRIASAAGLRPEVKPTDRSSGRRTALALWLTRPGNPLFLRTTVNRLWQQHFVKPLAGTPGDMGTQGEAPSHPELLDWLATELPRQGWSMKRLRKLMVMSTTYRQAGLLPPHDRPSPDPSVVDAENRLYSRMNRRRLTGEALRDAMLAVSGQLDLKTGGAGVRLPLPEEVAGTLLKKQADVSPDPAGLGRRSLYVFARRNLRYPLFEIFDRPDALSSCARREVSTTAPQALMLMNSPFGLETARRMARNLLAATGSDLAAVVEAAGWQCFSRPPTAAERQAGRAFLERQQALTSSLEDLVTDYCLALINASAFCYVD